MKLITDEERKQLVGVVMIADCISTWSGPDVTLWAKGLEHDWSIPITHYDVVIKKWPDLYVLGNEDPNDNDGVRVVCLVNLDGSLAKEHDFRITAWKKKLAEKGL